VPGHGRIFPAWSTHGRASVTRRPGGLACDAACPAASASRSPGRLLLRGISWPRLLPGTSLRCTARVRSGGLPDQAGMSWTYRRPGRYLIRRYRARPASDRGWSQPPAVSPSGPSLLVTVYAAPHRLDEVTAQLARRDDAIDRTDLPGPLDAVDPAELPVHLRLLLGPSGRSCSSSARSRVSPSSPCAIPELKSTRHRSAPVRFLASLPKRLRRQAPSDHRCVRPVDRHHVEAHR
jgi:hypothetical protein